ncbi:DNA polymerase III subunit delta [Candidatus Enterovibrio altilux]|uniref:DNA polymerase III subunit delta n=1 Tax=Candidatus Enterovibrio altilux TaxID=1927128 RepID=UPI001237E643|nr:DNA polymerase III subunit delta [Candidatus Enterovibrio luxaltus]
MKINPEQLVQHLAQGLEQNYLLFGNEPLLKQEALQAVLNETVKQGYDEKHCFTVNNQLNWQDVYDACQSLNLFSSSQVLILILPKIAINVRQINALKVLVSFLHQDIVLVLDGPKLNKKQEFTQWFTLFQKNGLYVPCNTPDTRELPCFIENRCRKLGLKPDRASILLIAQWHEGNLLALSQSLMKLQLLYPDGILTLRRLQDALTRHNHYTPYQLIDALVEGKAKRAVQIIRNLQAEDVELTLLVCVIQKEVIQLCKMQEYGTSGMGLNTLFDHFKIWQTRRSILTAALHRLPMSVLMILLRQLSDIEIMVKTDFESQPWLALVAFSLEMCGHPVLLAPIN